MGENNKKKFTIIIKGKEYEVSEELYLMDRRFRQREAYHQRKQEYSLDQAEEDMVPILYKYIKRLPSLEEKVLIHLEVERILKMIRSKSELDYYIIVAIFLNEFSETEVAKIMGTSRQSINKRKKRIIEWIRKQEANK